MKNKRNYCAQIGGLFLGALIVVFPTLACSQQSEAENSATNAAQPESPGWQTYGQVTYTDQYHPAFHSPYVGTNSLDPGARSDETFDLTLMLGHRLWNDAEFWINPEIDQGFGLSNTLGIAGFPSGEAYKIGENQPYLRLPRAFVRQVFNLGGEMQSVEQGANQLAGSVAANNITLTIGKFSVVDIFDANSYAHDPKGDFLNWSIFEAGAFDYAADPWGFTNGVALEWNYYDWTLRGGWFQLSEIPNAKMPGFHPHQYTSVMELEQRHDWFARPGKIRVLIYANRADIGSYNDAVALAETTDTTPNVALVRRYATSPGAILNIEQELATNVGLFARASIKNGEKETYEFTDINRSVSAGLVLQGDMWGRAGDKFGVAGVSNAISADAERYFEDGGLGILIGDGKLNYEREQIAESFYAFRLTEKVTLTADFQYVVNPAYNTDRGPVAVYALRLHGEF